MTKFKKGDIVIGIKPGQWATEKPHKIHEIDTEGVSFYKGTTSYILYDMETKEIREESHWFDTELKLVRPKKIKEWEGLI